MPKGLPGAGPVFILSIGKSFWLVAADAPLEIYGPGPLERALRDLQWVADVALAHEAVVERVGRMRGVTVVPMKLFTMFSTPNRAVEEIGSKHREIAAAAGRIAGSEEWSVRVIRSADGGRAAGAGRRGRAIVRAASGRAFLVAKKAARDEARQAIANAADAAEAAYKTLVPIAREARRRNDVPEGATSPPLLDAAFLVAEGRRARFRAAARRAAAACRRSGATMTLSGPWPAYNFVRPRVRSA
jgi:hypothetical protein